MASVKTLREEKNIVSRDLRDLTKLRISLHRGVCGVKGGKKSSGKMKVKVWLLFKIGT